MLRGESLDYVDERIFFAPLGATKELPHADGAHSQCEMEMNIMLTATLL